MIALPDVWFGALGRAVDWHADSERDPDDEELDPTPPLVVLMLGFDPKGLSQINASGDG